MLNIIHFESKDKDYGSVINFAETMLLELD